MSLKRLKDEVRESDGEKFSEELIKNRNKFLNKLRNINQDPNIKSNRDNFILTKEAQERRRKIYDFNQSCIPVLLVGPTGTAKTSSAESLHSEDEHLIVFNFSSETTIYDLMGRTISDKSSYGHFTFEEGPFVIAFSQGYPIILDEINLAKSEVLQSIEAALDSDVIQIPIQGCSGRSQTGQSNKSTKSSKSNESDDSYEDQEKEEGSITGSTIREYRRHPNFQLVATMNPNKGLFKNARENLSKNFSTRFQTILFPDMNRDELDSIAKELCRLQSFTNDIFISKLVDFHFSWTQRPDVQQDIYAFTIREILTCIHFVTSSESYSSLDSILCTYGARYPKERHSEMKRILEDQYPELCQINTVSQSQSQTNSKGKGNISLEETIISSPIFKCMYKTESFVNTLKYCLMALESHKHILLVGPPSVGKTHIARLIATYYNNEPPICFICTPETTSSDFIGRYIPVPKESTSTELITYKLSPLLESVLSGQVFILDNIASAPAKESERLNSLFDVKFESGHPSIFKVYENSSNPDIVVHERFRLIATCTEEELRKKISPALQNRFTIIYVNEQYESVSRPLVHFLSERFIHEEPLPEFSPSSAKEEEEKEEASHDSLNHNSYYDSLPSDIEDLVDHMFSQISTSHHSFSELTFFQLFFIKILPFPNLLVLFVLKILKKPFHIILILFFVFFKLTLNYKKNFYVNMKLVNPHIKHHQNLMNFLNMLNH